MPGGFGKRGIEGMINAIRYARERKVPYFGICLGMQTLVIEYARNVCGLEDADSTEFNSGHAAPRDLQAARTEGRGRAGRHHAAGRLALPAGREQLRATAPTAQREINERHRHRYEFNREYEERLTAAGLRITGETPDGTYVEICEIADHPWFLGCQFHPEFKSKPMEPHPLFKAFIGAAYEHRRAPPGARAGRSRRERSRSTRVPIEFTPPSARGQAAGADRRALRHRKRRARPPHGARHPRGGGRRSSSKRPSTRPTAPACGAYRGPGLREGLRILAGVKAEGFPVLTDIHEPAQAEPAAEVADILQIPAFLCRQTDLLLAAGRTGRIVNIKKGQFVAPHDIHHAAEKVASTGNRAGGADRARLLVRLQQPGGGHARPEDHARRRLAGGLRRHPQRAAAGRRGERPPAASREFIEPLARAAVAAGVDGVFVEVHDRPEKALSDGANALRLSLLARFLAAACEPSTRLVKSRGFPPRSRRLSVIE